MSGEILIWAPFVAGQHLGHLSLLYVQVVQPRLELLDARGINWHVLVDLERRGDRLNPGSTDHKSDMGLMACNPGLVF